MQSTPKRPSRLPRGTKAVPTAPSPRRTVGPRPTTIGLVERIVELQIRQVPFETFASEMVPLLLDALEVPAGALLLYHSESESLATIGSRALSPAGRQHLESLRRGAADSWEIPLHGLLNRKAYIIERPDEHPFVPELVARDVVPHAANLATIPLYRGQLPVGVLLAIADRNPIGERAILAHVLAFDTLALALDNYVRARVSLGGARLRVALANTAAEGEGAIVCETWVDPRETAARLEAELGSEQAARDVLATRLADAELQLTGVNAALARAVGERRRLLAEHDAESARLLAAEREGVERAQGELRAAIATRDATIAERDGALAAVASESERVRLMLTDERDQARAAAAETADLVRELRGSVAAVEREREALRAEHAEESARSAATRAEATQLAEELEHLRGEVSRLRDDRARVLAAVDEPGAEPAAVIRALREKVATRESEIAAHATERAELARRAAVQAEQVARQIAAQRHELDELRGAHERALDELRSIHKREVEETRTAHERALATALHTHEHARAEDEARQQALVAALRAEHADALATLRSERDARQHDRERLTLERDDLEGRLSWALTEREEVAAAASVRERAAVARLEAERRDVAAERAMLDEQRAGVERAHAADARQLATLEHELAERDDRVTALARDVEERDQQLGLLRAEVARLREDRERVLAVVDDPGAEPGAVIQALRERVASFEAQVRAFDEERVQAAAHAASEAEQAEHRLAMQRRELAEARSEHRAALEEAQATLRRELEQALAEHRHERELDVNAHREEITTLRDAGERRDADRRAALQHVEDDRDAALAAIRELRTTLATRETDLGERERMLSEVGGDRHRLEELAAASAAELERLRASVAELGGERDALRTRVETLQAADAERGAHLAAVRAERERQESSRVENDARAEQLATELAIIQAEALRLREDRARVLAAVDDEGAEPVTVIRALREQVVALEGQLAAHAAERVEVGRRAAAEARTTEERLAIARAEHEAADREHRRALEAAQTAHARILDESMAAQRKALEDARTAHQGELANLTTAHARMLAERSVEVERLEARRRAAIADAEALRAVLAAAERARDATLAAAASERERLRAVAVESSSRTAVAVPPEVVAETSDAPTTACAGSVEDAAATPAAEAPAATTQELSAAPPAVEVVQRDGHHILESDAARWEQIHAALSGALPPTPGRSLMVANLLAAFPSGLYDLTAAATAGATLVGYAADAHGRSCILGAVRCFVDPPTAAEAAAVLEAMPKGTRRILTLSEDVEAFLGAKIGLAKAGHSVSMACDAKQALDLLTMLTPDAVFVDLRTTPAAAAEFLAALAPESGRVLVVLVHGDPAGNILPCVIQRLLRPEPLDPSALLQTCRTFLAGPPSAVPQRSALVKAIRPLERPKILPRKPAARRLVPRRR
jgi:chromosome segregation ATPase